MSTPMYRALGKIYASPHTLVEGDVFKSTGFPGKLWQPLNDEARAKMELLYEKEFTLYDEFGKPVGKVKPNLSLRPAPVETIERSSLELVARAPPDKAGVLENPADMSKQPFIEPLVPTGEDIEAPNTPASLTSVDGSLEVVEQAPPSNPLNL